tara:strand:+ start:400 stop:729 length:330 start_codon:yes stop_codon:yes gene_type:complete
LEVEAKPAEVNYPLADKFRWGIGKGRSGNHCPDRFPVQHTQSAGPDDPGFFGQATVSLKSQMEDCDSILAAVEHARRVSLTHDRIWIPMPSHALVESPEEAAMADTLAV